MEHVAHASHAPTARLRAQCPTPNGFRPHASNRMHYPVTQIATPGDKSASPTTSPRAFLLYHHVLVSLSRVVLPVASRRTATRSLHAFQRDEVAFDRAVPWRTFAHGRRHSGTACRLLFRRGRRWCLEEHRCRHDLGSDLRQS